MTLVRYQGVIPRFGCGIATRSVSEDVSARAVPRPVDGNGRLGLL